MGGKPHRRGGYALRKATIVPRKIKGMGWRPDTPDFRDHQFTVAATRKVLPIKASLRQCFPSCYDQLAIGSCTANAIAAALEFDRRKQLLSDFIPSRLMIYWLERQMEGTLNEDAGAELRDGMKAVAKFGACDEVLWPYDIKEFKTKPSAAAFAQALETQAIDYARVSQNKHAIKTVIAAGFPVVFGFAVYESFEGERVSQTGIVPMPAKTEQMVGGHAVIIVGYDDTPRVNRFEIRNSWGTDWGMQGYFTMPMEYVLSENMASDFWVVRAIG